MKSLFALCWLNRHDPDFDLVRREMFDYVGHCRHCAAPIRRTAKQVWTRRVTQPATQRAVR